MRARVATARALQQQRFSQPGKVRCNARMSSQLLKTHCQLNPAATHLMEMAMSELNFSAGAYDRMLKVARIVADLEGQTQLQPHHVGEAIQYRTLDRKLWA
ncbi:MAG: ATP-binding protein [Chthoniobacteraceae bacterium]|nr:ATP-binding protein [Chthoniobacteraceae bacterium]